MHSFYGVGGGLAEYYWRDETLDSGKQILRVVWVHLDDLKKMDGDKQLELRLRIEGERFNFRYAHRPAAGG